MSRSGNVWDNAMGSLFSARVEERISADVFNYQSCTVRGRGLDNRSMGAVQFEGRRA